MGIGLKHTNTVLSTEQILDEHNGDSQWAGKEVCPEEEHNKKQHLKKNRWIKPYGHQGPNRLEVVRRLTGHLLQLVSPPKVSLGSLLHDGLRQTAEPEPADEADDSAPWRPSMSSSPSLAPHPQPCYPPVTVFILVSTSGASNSINTQTYGRHNKTQRCEPLFLKNKPGPKYQLIAKRALTKVY